ncbi:patatin-like phospholipase family protein [Actinomycetospora sp. CA-101289]|uniref:patatin-like phospholipase family protein n=1 Tax=Actinomycetospora sp. CA-101289 TaxID=3239893 RepID=UPI003D99B88D
MSPRDLGPGLAGLPRPLALVVGGGGCLGAAHVGVGLALEAHGFRPDLVVGTSAGALNGALVAAHPGEAAPWLRNVWTQMERRRVLGVPRPWQAGGVFPTDGLRRLIDRAGLPARVEELPVPFRAVATDVVTGEEVVMGDGDLVTALLASAAVPGVLPPVERDGRLLVDGGVVAYVPVLAALRAGAASIVALSSGPESWPMRPTAPRRRAAAVAARAGLFALHHQIERDLWQVAASVPTVVLPTGVEAWPSPWDFSQADRLITTARDAAERFLQETAISAAPGLYRVPGYGPPPPGAP